MKRCVETSTLACTPEQLWSLFLDRAYLEALYLEVLKFKAFSILELTDTTRKLAVSPRTNMPGPIEKLIGDSFAYEDHATLDRTKNEWTWRMMPPSTLTKPKKEVISTHGSTRVRVLGPKEIERTDELVAEGKVFGLGGIIESSAEKEFRAATAKELAFCREWLAKKLG
jgi:hypothetical protein